jgi:hypothetical protein
VTNPDKEINRRIKRLSMWNLAFEIKLKTIIKINTDSEITVIMFPAFLKLKFDIKIFWLLYLMYVNKYPEIKEVIKSRINNIFLFLNNNNINKQFI